MAEQVKIEISVRVTRKVDTYNIAEVASAKTEDLVLWNDIDPSRRGTALKDAAIDVLDRVRRQLDVEADRRDEIAREEQRLADADRIGL